MFTVVLLVCILNSDPSSSSSASFSSIATAAYSESDSDSSWDKFVGAFLNSLVFVAAITVATFVLVLLFYLRCVKFLKFYMGFSAFIVLGNLGGEILVLLIDRFRFPIDCITFLILLFNFSVVGVFAVFMSKFSILVTQGYLVWIGVLVAYFFTLLPEWTTWILLVALALYSCPQVHEMAMVSAIQEAQKDNVRSFNNYMLKVLEEDCRKEKRDFLHSLSKISMLPKTKMIDSSRGTHAGSLMALSPQVSSKPGMELVSMTNKPIHEKKSYVYAEVVKKLNSARERGLPFKLRKVEDKK
ncbi:PREDICTED: presenilin-like protein At2g29900 [Camelina sativa]|uniref:Presenilin-like protein At2g29900 n=1 Tax=Camelina sativa TaxID=90675 RepID=A0ABM0Z5F8_CAMSA|nr:PREDICTED: presenilin-like protein At2g29900 [Camelina sativa]